MKSLTEAQRKFAFTNEKGERVSDQELAAFVREFGVQIGGFDDDRDEAELLARLGRTADEAAKS